MLSFLFPILFSFNSIKIEIFKKCSPSRKYRRIWEKFPRQPTAKSINCGKRSRCINRQLTKVTERGANQSGRAPKRVFMAQYRLHHKYNIIVKIGVAPVLLLHEKMCLENQGDDKCCDYKKAAAYILWFLKVSTAYRNRQDGSPKGRTDGTEWDGNPQRRARSSNYWGL